MKNLLFFLSIFLSCTCFSQEDAWLFLKDKPNATSYLNNPLSMLSQRAIDRRVKQNIALDIKDVPVHQNYYNTVKGVSNLVVLAKSKWLNAIHVQGTKQVIDNAVANFSFVDYAEYANKSLNSSAKFSKVKLKKNHHKKLTSTTTDINYGKASNQIEMLKGDFLHKEGFTGSGIQIAVIDAGFPNVNTLSGFERLRNNNQILGGYDFVNRSTNFYSGNSHGTHVLSTIGGYIENEFVGTAPDASFYLFISEDASKETPLEESLWVEAAERADSLGVDVINTSLGYTTFDNTNYSYTYSNMDGKTTFITRGAEIGVSRGMILVNAAGNDGAKSWKYIGAPADAKSVLAVGAVTASKSIASFSSFGPTADNRTKPDVLAQGQGAYVINYQSGNTTTSSGTSFAAPILAGTIACFWQAFPNKTNLEIIEIIKQSTDRYNNPDSHYGYGIPNFKTAKETLVTNKLVVNDLKLNVYPNPVKQTLYLDLTSKDLKNYSLKIYSVLGKKVVALKKGTIPSTINLAHLSSGIYLLQLQNKNQQATIKLVKK